MMEEVSGDDTKAVTEKLADAQIADLRDAALTDVTQASASNREGTPPRSTASGLTGIAPPSELPADFAALPVVPMFQSDASSQPAQSYASPAPMMPTAQPATPPRTMNPYSATKAMTPPPVGQASPSQVTGASPRGGSAPPPPTGGFVPTAGIVKATPPKEFFNIQSPSGDQSITAGPPPPMQSPMTSATQQPIAPTVFSPAPSQATAAPVYVPDPVPAPQPSNISHPSQMQSPYSATSSVGLAIDSPNPYVQDDLEEDRGQDISGGLFGWIAGSGFVNKVVEKTKHHVETMITTLDPGMKEVILSGGDIDIVVTSLSEVKVSPVRDAFQSVFGRATIRGMESHPSIAPQPVGYTAAQTGAEERINLLKQNGRITDQQTVVSVENFIAELLPDRWFDMACLVLRDPVNSIELTTFSQATPVPSEYRMQAEDRTPQEYDRRWSGLAVTIGQVMQASMPHVDHADWHKHFTSVSRADMIKASALMLANMYKLRLPVPEH